MYTKALSLELSDPRCLSDLALQCHCCQNGCNIDTYTWA
jgi:hypothetical protein